MPGAGPEKKSSKKATASRNSGRSNSHSGHKSPSCSLKTSDKDALHEDPRTRLTEFPSIPEEPASSSSPSMFSKLFGSGGGEVKRDDTKPQVEPARANSMPQSREMHRNESRRSSASSLQRNIPVRRRSDAEESLRSIRDKNSRAIDAVLAKAFEANKEVLSGSPPRSPSSYRLHTPKHVYSSDWTEVTESTAEHSKVCQLLERINKYSCLQGCKIFFRPSACGRNTFEAKVSKPIEHKMHMHSEMMTRTTIATGLGTSSLEAILDCEGGIEYYVSLHKGTWEKIQDLLCLQQ